MVGILLYSGKITDDEETLAVDLTTTPDTISVPTEPGMVATQAIVCSYPPDPLNARRNAIFVADIQCLRPKAFINDVIVDFEIKKLQDYLASASGVKIFEVMSSIL